MMVCQSCNKGINIQAYSRHKKGSSGAGGNWALRAPIHKRVQRPNLHTFKGMKLCTKCLRALKSTILAKAVVSGAPASAVETQGNLAETPQS